MAPRIVGPISPWFWIVVGGICIVTVVVPAKFAASVVDRPGTTTRRRAWSAVLGLIGAATIVVAVLSFVVSIDVLSDPLEDDRTGLAATFFVIAGWPAMSIASLCVAALWQVVRPRRPLT